MPLKTSIFPKYASQGSYQCIDTIIGAEIRFFCRAAAVGPGPLPVAPTTKFLRFLDANYIPIALIGSIVFGWLCPGPGTFAAARNLQTFSTIGIFIISGILLQRGEAAAALRSPIAIAFGILSTLLITPLAAFGVMRLPLHPPEMALGLAVFLLCPDHSLDLCNPLKCLQRQLCRCLTLSNSNKCVRRVYNPHYAVAGGGWERSRRSILQPDCTLQKSG
ncbi:hypothetical protein Ndes2526B_g08597 [Nannochloris sp. 'desiccata']